MPLTLRIRKGVAADVRSAMHGFSRFVRAEIWVPHRLTVTVERSSEVTNFNEQYGWGWIFHRKGARCLRIRLAGGLPPLVDIFNGDRQAALEETVSTYAHEIVHYEQFRDGRKVQEPGVAVRTRNLLKRYDNWRADRGQ